MKNNHWLGLGFWGFSVACGATWLTACSKSEAPNPSLAAASVSAIPQVAPAATGSTEARTALGTAPPEAKLDQPPASFATGKKETIDAAVGLGCEAKSSGGFLELLCRKKNGSGGHPVQAVLNAESNETVQADEHGELRFTTPFRDGETKDITIEWSDTRYVLHVVGASAKLEWGAAGVELRRACSKLAEESRVIVQNAQKGDDATRVLPADVAKFPHFGVCQPAGLGSFALALKELSASAAGDARRLHAVLEVVHVSEQGALLSAPFASFDFLPGGLDVLPLQIYDYDDDGKDELIVSYDLKAVPPGVNPEHPANIWSFSDSGVTSYAKAPELDAGGTTVEHLDFDMRPDIGDYGGYVAWLGADCGLKQCPARVTGPRFFSHSLPDGGFSRNDSAAKAALKRACPKKPDAIVVDNAAQTAKNLVCARVFGVSIEAVNSELSAKHEALCGSNATCAFAAALAEWAKALPPVSLED